MFKNTNKILLFIGIIFTSLFIAYFVDKGREFMLSKRILERKQSIEQDYLLSKVVTEVTTNTMQNLVPELTSEEKLRAQIKKLVTTYSNEFDKQKHASDFDSCITEIKIDEGTHGKIILVKYNSCKGELSGDPWEDAAVIYKGIFTYGDKVQKAIVEEYMPKFMDKYGNICNILGWSSKIDNSTTISKVNWKNIPIHLVNQWWTYVYVADVEQITCK